ncbi:unnamed protein product [Plutella xylostella]|uniref:(diamondback moth) hypothetical protein n=1 Tax=Plutella xylostella TaxID=51655 RepID=A0A8S4FGP8_PLUXY|nr:unnamed protein product [Plutella xylostella]
MAENREEILANFQGITAIDDVAEAIYHLEESNWDLLTAINRVMPQDGNNPTAQPSDSTHDVEMIDEDISVITPKIHPPDRIDTNEASTSSPRNNVSNLVELQVNFNNKMHEIKMSSSATVSDLKKRLELVCGVPYCRQQLSGLGGSRATAGAALGSLGLARGQVLRLKAADQQAADDEVAELLTQTYTLKVKFEDKDYTLKFPGTKTVQEVKNDFYALTDVPVRHQQWSGWPSVPGLDDTVLAMAGLSRPEHELAVKRAPAKQKDYKRIIIDSSDSENSSVEEVEDSADGFVAEDDMFVDLVQSERLQPLMSEAVEDEAIGCIEFGSRFRARYGPNTPSFFEGTLADAIKEACLKPAKDRKLLGVYLHHEQSVLSHVFCAQLLGCETVLHTLAHNFVLYGWDLTHASNNQIQAGADVSTASAPRRVPPPRAVRAVPRVLRAAARLRDRAAHAGAQLRAVRLGPHAREQQPDLLGVYLHHEQSVLSHVFCAQLLGCETVLHTLAHNFVLYGWDLTHASNNQIQAGADVSTASAPRRVPPPRAVRAVPRVLRAAARLRDRAAHAGAQLRAVRLGPHAREQQPDLLGVYLHHEQSVLSHVFCAQLLGCETVLHTLAHNFVLYGWDLTHASNNQIQAGADVSTASAPRRVPPPRAVRAVPRVLRAAARLRDRAAHAGAQLRAVRLGPHAREQQPDLLGVYLHHEQSVLSHVFCAQLLGCETVLHTLAHNFVLYGWDLTHASNNQIQAGADVSTASAPRRVPPPRAVRAVPRVLRAAARLRDRAAHAGAQLRAVRLGPHAREQQPDLLGVYLHHEQSVLSHVFCAQLLGCETVLHTLAHNFVLYGWDLTHASNNQIQAGADVSTASAPRRVPPPRAVRAVPRVLRAAARLRDRAAHAGAQLRAVRLGPHAREQQPDLLGVYLHHEQSVLSHVFCAQLLGCETVLHTLAHNFVLYGWDLTHASNNQIQAGADVSTASAPRRVPPPRAVRAVPRVLRAAARLRDRAAHAGAQLRAVRLGPHAREQQPDLLGVYLHHEQSVLSHVFCAQLLGCETVLHTLAHNFVLYGWDLTHASNNQIQAGADVSTASAPRRVPPPRAVRAVPRVLRAAARLRDRAAHAGAQLRAVRLGPHAREQQPDLLGVYLHHEQSVLSHVFCAQLLGCETVLHTLAHNFVLYGWDLTHASNNQIQAGADVSTASAPRRVPPPRAVRAVPRVLRAAARLRDRAAHAGAQLRAVRLGPHAREQQPDLLGVYLHHEQSVLSHVFCAQLLGCETVLHTLAHNFVLYGWDLTHASNNQMLLTSIANALGPMASMTVRSIPVERLPALLVIMRVRSNTEIYSVINGNVGVSELVGQLVEAIERFAAARDQDAKAEHEREARQRVKREQDEAYQQSLEADRAKEEVKKQVELEKNQEIERAENERLQEEARKQAHRSDALSRVPPEPAASDGDVSRIRVRLPPPHDTCLERRFRYTDTLQALLDYLASEGFPHESYKVISGWPRRDLTTEPLSSTLQALKLTPQETVMLEER